MHRVYISGPGDLNADKQLCREVIGEVNETAMPFKVLLAAVNLPQEGQLAEFRSAVADNIRQCAYYVQIFQDDWGPSNLGRKMFYLAFDGRSDEGLPMKDVVVFLKDAPRETDPAILAFRKELQEVEGIRVFRYKNTEEIREQFSDIAQAWVQDIVAAKAQAAVAT